MRAAIIAAVIVAAGGMARAQEKSVCIAPRKRREVGVEGKAHMVVVRRIWPWSMAQRLPRWSNLERGSRPVDAAAAVSPARAGEGGAEVSEVKRYTQKVSFDGLSHRMVEFEHGEYVRYCDHHALAAENAQLREQLAERTDNADFLRSMVGACHSMISRNDMAELQRKEWESTTLPPRLHKFITDKLAASQHQVEQMRTALEMMLRQGGPLGTYGEYAFAKARAALAQPEGEQRTADKQRGMKGETHG